MDVHGGIPRVGGEEAGDRTRPASVAVTYAASAAKLMIREREGQNTEIPRARETVTYILSWTGMTNTLVVGPCAGGLDQCGEWHRTKLPAPSLCHHAPQGASR